MFVDPDQSNRGGRPDSPGERQARIQGDLDPGQPLSGPVAAVDEARAGVETRVPGGGSRGLGATGAQNRESEGGSLEP